MRILLCGYMFWIFTVMVALRVTFSGKTRALLSSWRSRFSALFLLCLGLIVFFRPHEDIFGGQDGGAYLNTAARLARDPHLSYIDVLLANVSPEARSLFLYYGPNRPYLSKYACGRVTDFDRGICGVWFQPAYPVTASILARHLGLRAVLYAVPVFAILLAFTLRALFAELWPERAALGDAAAFLFIANPLVTWHARHPRPEIIASFLLFSAGVLLLRAWYRPQGVARIFDVLLGSLALTLAPFFHITAWMMVLPAALLITVAILRGRRAFLLYPIIAYVGLRAFIWQLQHITDTYGLLRRVPWIAEHPIAQTVLFGVLLGSLYLISRCDAITSRWMARIAVVLPKATAAAIVISYSACWVLARLNPPTKDWPPIHHYMYRTDVSALLNFISRPVAAFVLAGFLWMALSAKLSRAARLALLWAAIPATLLIGNFYDFFVTRYLLVSFLPLASLALASLVVLCPLTPSRYFHALPPLATLFLAALLLRGRTHLVTTTEYRGLQDHLQALAQPILRENGILLFEYPRLAAPFDLTFGVPTLALHNERDDDYSVQERAWETIMRRFPNRPAYFITPFQQPRSDRFVFLPYGSVGYSGSRLVQKRWDLPTDVREWNVTLRVYRMLLAAAAPATEIPMPNILEFGDGNLGLRRFARVPQKPRHVDVAPLAPGKNISLRLSAAELPFADHHQIVLLVVTSHLERASITLNGPGGSQTVPIQKLVNEWWFAVIHSANPLHPNDEIQVTSDAPVHLHDILIVDSNRCVALAASPAWQQLVTLQPLHTRWARQGASVCVPVTTKCSMLLVFHTAPDELANPVCVKASSPLLRDSAPRIMPPGRWMWTAWYVQPQETPLWAWVTFYAEPSFDPQMRGYPSDLITHFGWVCMAPL